MDSDQIIKACCDAFHCKPEEVVARARRLVLETDQMRSGVMTDPALIKKIDKLRRKKEGQERAGQIKRFNSPLIQTE